MKDRTVAEEQVNPTIRPHSINLDKLLHSIVDVIIAIDEKGIFNYVSASSFRLFGYSSEEMTGKSFINFIHPEDIERTLEAVIDRTHNCRTSNFANRYYSKDGSLIHIVWSARWDEQDRVLYCVARDGSERHTSEQRLLKAQQMANVANFEYDVINKCYTYTSETICQILGYDKSVYPLFTLELFWSLLHPEDLQHVQNIVLNPGKHDHPSLEFRIIRPDGKLIYINRFCEFIYNAAGNIIKTVGTIQDITTRKTFELALKESEDRLTSLVQNGNDLIGIIDIDGNYTFVGENVMALLGHDAQAMIGKSAFEFIHPDDVSKAVASLQEIKHKKTITISSFRFKNGNGDWRWMETVVSNHLENPSIKGLVINSKDITEKKIKDDELILSEKRFKALVQNGSDLIVIIDEKLNFSYASDNVLAILGYNPKEMVGKSALHFVHPDDLQKVGFQINNVLVDGGGLQGVQHRFLHKNGNWIWLESRGSNRHDHLSIRGILVNARNIDDRVYLQNRLNTELMNKQKEITAAVIKAQEAERSQLGRELHDNVNQILTTVKLYNEMYLTGYVQDKELLVRSTQYTQDCINEIRSISKRLSAPTLGKISLRDSIKELIDSINLTKRVEISYQTQDIEHSNFPEDLHLAVYRIVQESLNNIIKYAQAATASITICKENNLLELHISDNGKGFDTKAKSAGIGITNMKTRAESLNANFQLTSAPGKGCKIVIKFPLVKG